MLQMVSAMILQNIASDYMKLAMSYENDKTEIDPVLRSRVWGVVLVGLASCRW
jgi:hypothetical protein